MVEVSNGSNESDPVRVIDVAELIQQQEELPSIPALFDVAGKIPSLALEDARRFFEEWKKCMTEHKRLSEGARIASLWGVEGPPERQVHLFVRPVEVPNNKRKCDLDEETSDGKNKRRRREALETTAITAPSSMAHPIPFLMVAGPEGLIGDSFEPSTIPISLLCDVFGKFRDRAEQPPSMGARALLQELTGFARERLPLETEKRYQFARSLKSRLNLDLCPGTIPGTESTTDGHTPFDVVPAAIRACNNEPGLAVNKALCYYLNFIHHRAPGYAQEDSLFPCILIVEYGVYLEFYGVVWDGDAVRARVEPLTHGFNLLTHQTEGKARDAIASSFDAFSETVKHIEAHYKELKNGMAARSDPHPTPSFQYPHMASFNHIGQAIALTYDFQYRSGKLLFGASAKLSGTSTHDLTVKFTRRYSEEAHRYLAEMDYAPTIWDCVSLPGGWIAVVMDESKWRPLHAMELTDQVWEKVRSKATQALQRLHEGGFVHGDVRDCNILIDPKSVTDDEVKLHFIDFDWAGRDGEAKYPLGVNIIDVQRPDGVEDGKLITKQHDLDMVSYLRSKTLQ